MESVNRTHFNSTPELAPRVSTLFDNRHATMSTVTAAQSSTRDSTGCQYCLSGFTTVPCRTYIPINEHAGTTRRKWGIAGEYRIITGDIAVIAIPAETNKTAHIGIRPKARCCSMPSNFFQ